MGGSGEDRLRAKYLDWCSARLAERFLDLTPEEIYALAQPGTGPGEGAPGDPEAEAGSGGVVGGAGGGEPGGGAGPRVSLPYPTEEGYRTLVQRVTEALLRRTSLPTFEQWSVAYRESPDRFEAELLGFWRDVASPEESTDDQEG
ncbi:MAG: hypothetical protein ACOC5J_03190 [Gemmatimonadota bacterium]